MSRDVVVQAVLEYLQQKYDLSDLEKDIMSTLSNTMSGLLIEKVQNRRLLRIIGNILTYQLQ